MIRNQFTIIYVIILSALFITTQSSAFRQPESSELRDKSFRHSDLSISQVYLSASQAVNVRYAQSISNLDMLGVPLNSAYIDTRSGRFGTLLTSVPMLPGKGKDNNLSWQNTWGIEKPTNLEQHKQLAWNALLNYINTNKQALGINSEELQNPPTITLSKGGELVQINIKRFIDGIPVRDSFINAVINNGNLVLFGAINWGDVNISRKAVVSKEMAQNTASQYLGSFEAETKWGKSILQFVPIAASNNSFRLVWVIDSRIDSDQLANWESMVDAHNGELVAFQDTTNYASPLKLVGGQFPVSNDGMVPDGVEVTSPMPYVDVTVNGQTYYTDTGGNVLACLEGDMTTSLKGQYLTMTDNCGEISETEPGPFFDIGSGPGTDCSVPSGSDSSGNTHASRSGYYEINRIIEMARAQLPNNNWIRRPVSSTMNIDSTCNASGGGGGFAFFASGGGCANTGELAGVFDHEWGHGMDDSDANPGVSNPPEGIADIFASLRLNTSCIGRNFKLGLNCGGFGDPCTSCDGVRDIDWEKRASGIPHDVEWVDANCGSGNGSPCGGSVHCEGVLPAESVWDMWNRDLMQAPFNLSKDSARELAVQLTFQGGGMVGNWFSCAAGTGVGDGCNSDSGYMNYLAADDDDGDLSNGTPHMTAIFASFDRHGIACPTPTVQDSGCALVPEMAPVVSVTEIDRAVELSWTAVANATGYKVYKTEGVQGCDFGKTLIAETTNLSFLDTGLSNGTEYSYIVIPMGAGSSCFGTASSCTSATPMAGANLGLDALSTQLILNSGDGDSYLDNCESATVNFNVSNLGSGMINDVSIQSVKSTSHPSLDSSIMINSISPTNLDECSIASSGFSFFASELAHNDTIEFEICVTSTELAPAQRCGTVLIKNTESDDQTFATKSFSFEQDLDGWKLETGTFNRTSGSAADGTFAMRSSSFQDNQCDEIRSPLIKLGATSTLSLQTNFNIENQTSGTWWDRSNVAIVQNSQVRNLVSPDSGRLYNATIGPEYSGCNKQEQGWGGSATSWEQSTWSNAALTGFEGEPVQLSVTYGTDGASVESGFWFDDIILTDVQIQVEDSQSNMCINDVIFANGFE